MEEHGKKCACWHEKSDLWQFGSGCCWGTKECDPCDCGGDRSKCDFFPEIREKAAQEQCGGKEPEEIRNALSICSTTQACNMYRCPYVQTENCTDRLKEDALRLIKLLEEKVERRDKLLETFGVKIPEG